jgi:SAM-dependent methyltransferase
MDAGARGESHCAACGRAYALDEGILLAMGELEGKNRVVEAFYNGPRFEKFRFWENLFLWYAGGPKGARRQILRHLPFPDGGTLLEVGIGDGENLRLLPAHLSVTGIDIARRRLYTCRQRHPERALVLALAEAERMPFADGVFDAVLCVGGFNFFSDPAGALGEMARVTRRGGRVVVADEIPDFHRYGWGHRVRVPAFDRWLMRRWFGEAFAELILTNEIDVGRLAAEALADCRVHRIWRGYGYCVTGSPL